MTVLEELEQKIVSAEADIRRALDKLSGLAELETALGDTTRSLTVAAGGLAKLSGGLEAAIAELKSALTAFRHASDTLRETDPGKLLNAVSRAEARLEAIQAQLTASLPRLEKIEPGLREVIEQFGGYMKRELATSAADAKAVVETSQTRIMDALAVHAATLRSVRAIATIALLVGIAILGIELYFRLAR